MSDHLTILFILAMIVLLFVGLILIEHRVDKIERVLREGDK